MSIIWNKKPPHLPHFPKELPRNYKVIVSLNKDIHT